jgi:hypothetical protein
MSSLKFFLSLLLFGIALFSCTINNYYDCDCCNEKINDDVIFGENEIIFQPGSENGKDAFIEYYPERNYSNRNFGTNPEFMASAWTAQGIPLVVRNLIAFDLSQIPRNKTIKSARLYLFAVDNTTNGPGHSSRSGSNEFLLQRITSEWNEMEVTWNTQPNTTEEGQILVSESEHSMQNYSIVVTALVKDIIRNPSSGHGLMIKLVKEDYYRRILFASSDYEDSSKHPKLIIEFE